MNVGRVQEEGEGGAGRRGEGCREKGKGVQGEGERGAGRREKGRGCMERGRWVEGGGEGLQGEAAVGIGREWGNWGTENEIFPLALIRPQGGFSTGIPSRPRLNSFHRGGRKVETQETCGRASEKPHNSLINDQPVILLLN